MEKEFIPYEQALALKELGFESPYPIGGYQGGKVFYYEKGELYYDSRPMYSSDAHSGQILAPLYQQAFRWFREKYGYDVTIKKCTPSEYKFEIEQLFVEGNNYYFIDFSFDTYEEAEVACLRKLIEIVKRK
jgi:hypothetical protein